MDGKNESDRARARRPTNAERKSDRELVATRTFDYPARLVFESWTKGEIFRRWWAPKSFGLTIVECEMDARVGGGYRLVFVMGDDDTKRMAFFGKYLEVVPNERLVWTNDEGDGPGAVTTVTLEEKDGITHLVMHDLYPTKEALDEAISSGSTSCTGETFDQLDDLIDTSGACAGR